MRNRLVPKWMTLTFVSRSYQGHFNHCVTWRWISRKPLEIEAWFQRTTNRKWHMGYRMVMWPMTSHEWIGLCSVLRPRQHNIGYMGDGFYRSKDPRRCCEAVRSAIRATAWLLVIKGFLLTYLLTMFFWWRLSVCTVWRGRQCEGDLSVMLNVQPELGEFNSSFVNVHYHHHHQD